MKPRAILQRIRRIWRVAAARAEFSYAQHAEDLLIRNAFDLLAVARPTYLDIGAHHPTRLSNTYLLYTLGSQGICVEPNPVLCDNIRRCRPRDRCLNVGIGFGAADATDFYILSDPTLSTFSKDIASEQVATGRYHLERVISVPMMSVNKLVADHFRPSPNLLSLDTEGLDFDILRSWDFARFRPEIICLETITNPGERKMNEIIEFVRGHGYQVFADTYINTIFVESICWAEGRARRNRSSPPPAPI